MNNNRYHYETYIIDYTYLGERYEKKVVIRESNDAPKWIPRLNFLRAKLEFINNPKHKYEKILAVVFTEE